MEGRFVRLKIAWGQTYQFSRIGGEFHHIDVSYIYRYTRRLIYLWPHALQHHLTLVLLYIPPHLISNYRSGQALVNVIDRSLCLGPRPRSPKNLAGCATYIGVHECILFYLQQRAAKLNLLLIRNLKTFQFNISLGSVCVCWGGGFPPDP